MVLSEELLLLVQHSPQLTLSCLRVVIELRFTRLQLPVAIPTQGHPPPAWPASPGLTDCHISLGKLPQGKQCLTGIASSSKQLKALVFRKCMYTTMQRERIAFLMKCFLSFSPEENLKAQMIFKVTSELMQGLQQK